LVAEAFPWQEGSQFVYSQDNHNSVLGIRELALDQGATATCVEMSSAQGDLLYSCVSMGMCLLQAVPHLLHVMLCMLCLTGQMFVACCATPCHVMLCMLCLTGQMLVACCAIPFDVVLCMLCQKPHLWSLQQPAFAVHRICATFGDDNKSS